MSICIRKTATVTSAVAAFIFVTVMSGCGPSGGGSSQSGSQASGSLQEVLVLTGESVHTYDPFSEIELEAKLMWPTDKELDLRSKGPTVLAGRFLTDPPAWGTYSGVSQSSIEDENGVRLYNEIHLVITSPAAIEDLKQYAVDHKYREAIIVVCTEVDFDSEIGEAFFLGYEDARAILDGDQDP
ncbi:MAG: hypothetical protein JJ974_00785 [Phycisphaerales bacterium]|nr:hypothetical protein [Phycisphaerales bacterium]